MGGPIPQAVFQRQSLTPVPYIPIRKWLTNSQGLVVDSHDQLQVNRVPWKPALALHFPGPRQLHAEGLAQHSQPAILIVVFGADHTGVSVQRHPTQWDWAVGTTFFGSGVVPSQGDSLSLRFPRLAVVSPSESAGEHGQKLHQEERPVGGGWGKPAPELRLQQCRGLQGVSGGALPPTPLLGSPERRPSPSTFPVGIRRSQQNP